MKKVITIFLIITILFFNFVLADDIETQEIIIDEVKQEAIQTIANSTDEPTINSRAAVVIDRNTKQILYQKNCNEKRAMASTTKIMTAIITLENAKLDEQIEVSKKAAGVGGSRLGLHTGDKITINDLLYGLMLRSRKRCSSSISRNNRRRL